MLIVAALYRRKPDPRLGHMLSRHIIGRTVASTSMMLLLLFPATASTTIDCRGLVLLLLVVLILV